MTLPSEDYRLWVWLRGRWGSRDSPTWELPGSGRALCAEMWILSSAELVEGRVMWKSLEMGNGLAQPHLHMLNWIILRKLQCWKYKCHDIDCVIIKYGPMFRPFNQEVIDVINGAQMLGILVRLFCWEGKLCQEIYGRLTGSIPPKGFGNGKKD